MSDTAARRPIRSYVLRQGRMTEAQRRALEQLWPRYGVALGGETLDLAALFGRAAPVVLEIGFGNGDALVAAALARPDWNFLGAEVHRPGVGSLLLKLARADIDNVRVVLADANDVLARLAPASLHGVHLFFPDPWPKKRHHKRRLMQPAFAARLRDVLAPGGYLHCATDWEDYAAHMLAVLEATPGLANAAGTGRYPERPPSRPLTRFERRGAAEGRPARDLLFRRVPVPDRLA
ncbi:MAG TPA: tRNA (guanosine(46)-N7)-methyltransferase TrmB [Burkholderiales bacterium]